MEAVESKITSKGQISIPLTVRKRLGLNTGERIQWIERGGEIVVRRASRFSSQDIHQAVFTKAPPHASPEEMDKGIRQRMRKKHARR